MPEGSGVLVPAGDGGQMVELTGTVQTIGGGLGRCKFVGPSASVDPRDSFTIANSTQTVRVWIAGGPTVSIGQDLQVFFYSGPYLGAEGPMSAGALELRDAQGQLITFL